jgi:phosphate transport system protein
VGEIILPTDPILVVHGGAWAIPDDMVEAHLNGVRNAAAAGWRVLERGGSALDAVEEAVVALEDDLHAQKLIRGVEHMASLVSALLKQVLDAYASHDLATALAVWKGDEEVDALCTALFRELLTYMMEDPRNITFCMHLMFCAKDIERIGDHATNIAETVYYMIEGRPITEQRPKGDTTSFGAALLQQ